MDFLLPSLWTTFALYFKQKKGALDKLAVKVWAMYKRGIIFPRWKLTELQNCRSCGYPGAHQNSIRKFLGELNKPSSKFGAYVNVLLALCLEKPKGKLEERAASICREKRDGKRGSSGKEA